MKELGVGEWGGGGGVNPDYFCFSNGVCMMIVLHRFGDESSALLW